MFTFLVSIMMINFFIALMSNSVNTVSQYREPAMLAQKRSVAFTLERRCYWLMKSVFKRIAKRYLQFESDRILLVEACAHARCKKK